MAEIALEQPPQPRDVREVARLSVAPAQPREDADDLAMTLRAEDDDRRIERGAVEGGEGGAIARIHRVDELRPDLAPRILEQRDEIVGDGAKHRVLKIEQAACREPVAPGDAHEI